MDTASDSVIEQKPVLLKSDVVSRGIADPIIRRLDDALLRGPHKIVSWYNHETRYDRGVALPEFGSRWSRQKPLGGSAQDDLSSLRTIHEFEYCVEPGDDRARCGERAR